MIWREERVWVWVWVGRRTALNEYQYQYNSNSRQCYANTGINEDNNFESERERGGTILQGGGVRVSLLTLVDLAGSERAQHTNAAGERGERERESECVAGEDEEEKEGRKRRNISMDEENLDSFLSL